MKRAPDTPRLGKEMVLEAANLTNAEARFLAANYYQAQDARKRNDMQLRHLGDRPDDSLLRYTANSNAIIEKQVQRALQKFAENNTVGKWLLAQHGVGPVIAAGLLAHLDVTRTETAGGFWRFAGLDPTAKWQTGQKRPFNPDLKQLCFHFGECVKRSSNHPDSFYGKIYRDRKAFLVARNDAGGNAERAKTYATKSSEVKAKLATGKLPDGNIDRQACNYTAKMFLSHLHAVMYWDHFKKPPPKPFAISHLGHAHEIKVPLASMFSGFEEAYYGGPSSIAA